MFEDNTLISLAHITWFMSQFVIGQLLTYQLGLFGSTISLPSDSKDNDFVKYFKLLQQKLWWIHTKHLCKAYKDSDCFESGRKSENQGPISLKF